MSDHRAVGRGEHNNQENEQLQNHLGQFFANTALPPENHLQPWAAPLNNPWHLDQAGNFVFRPNAATVGGAPNQQAACTACQEDFLIKDLCCLGCRHWHCRNCLRRNATIALASQPFNPAKCCRVIPKESLQEFGALTDQELEQYGMKIEELTTPRRKLYCWGKDCGAFIPAANRTTRIGQCNQSGCKKRTCRACQNKSHFGPCDKAKLEACKKAEDEIYRLAEQKGWKRCPNCLEMVQKNGGCNHMSCHCGQDFCYLCGQVYGSMGHICQRTLQQAALPPPAQNQVAAVQAAHR